jgi:hypothetical protein
MYNNNGGCILTGVIGITLGLGLVLGGTYINYQAVSNNFLDQQIATAIASDTCDGKDALNNYNDSVSGRLHMASQYLDKHKEGKYTYNPSPVQAKQYLIEAQVSLEDYVVYLESDGEIIHEGIEAIVNQLPDEKRASVEEMRPYREQVDYLIELVENRCYDFYGEDEELVRLEELKTAKRYLSTAAYANAIWWLAMIRGLMESLKD